MSQLRALLVICLVLGSSTTFACPVCGASKAENDWAFGITTLVLSTLPPLIFGGLVAFFIRASRKRQREESSISTPD